MNVLLLLSALLSAITGVNVGGGRVPLAAEQVARAAEAATAAVATAPAVSHAPIRALDRGQALLTATPVVRLGVVGVPLYASRRRE